MKRYAFLVFLILSPVTAGAENSPNILNDQQIEGATRAMEEVAKNLTDILGIILRSIPQFEAPVILPNGDILIRRVQAKPDAAGAGEKPISERSKI